MHDAMSPLGRAVLDLLSQISGGPDAEGVEREARAHASRPMPVVTFVGVYDSGKSSIIKRELIEDGKEVPAWLTVSARKETFEVRECEALGCILRDTPGISVGDQEHERRARAAIALSDVIVVTVTYQLLTSDRDAILDILSGRMFTPRGLVMPPRALHVVVARMDEAGADPLDDLVGYRAQVAGKLGELHDLLTRHGLGEQPIETHAVCADLEGKGESHRQPPRSFFDRSREWDGIASFGEVLSSLSAELPTLRAAALERYFLLVANQAQESLEHELERLRLELDTCQNHKERLCLVRDQLEALSSAARASLDGIVEEQIQSAARMHGLTAFEVAQAAEAALNESLDGWRRDQEATIAKLAHDASEELEGRWGKSRRAASSLGALLGAAEDSPQGTSSDPGGKWLVEGLRRFGPRVVDAVRSVHELALGMSIRDAQRELARIDSLGSFEKYVRDAGKRRALRDAEHAATAGLAVRMQGAIAALGPLLIELASLYAERQVERRAAQERVRKLDELRSRVGEQMRVITAEEWKDFEELVSAFRGSLAVRMEPLTTLESNLSRVVSDLENACHRLAVLAGGGGNSKSDGVSGAVRLVEVGKGRGPSAARPIKVVVSYADADREHLEALEKHLKLPEQNGTLRVWHRGMLTVGALRAVADETLAAADVIVLLISSNYHEERLEEAKVAMARRAAGVRVIPVRVRATSTAGAPYADLEMLPKVGRAIPAGEGRDEAWMEVVDGVLGAAG